MTRLLKFDGAVENPVELTFDDLLGLPADAQIPDVSRIDSKRKGAAVTFQSLLHLVRPRPEACYLGLHSARDNFHASIPLNAVHDRALVIYRLNDQPLDVSAGGPVRFYIPDHAACRTDEIDECANVKFVDHMELTADKGFDNRPHDEKEHAKLHEHSNDYTG